MNMTIIGGNHTFDSTEQLGMKIKQSETSGFKTGFSVLHHFYLSARVLIVMRYFMRHRTVDGS